MKLAHMSRLLFAVIVLCMVGVLAACSAVVVAFTQTNRERDALVQFVCAGIQTAREHPTPESLIRAARFEVILGELGESCPTKEEP